MIKINFEVKGLNEAINDVKKLLYAVDRGLVLLGDATVEKMRENIKKSAHRYSSGRLGNSIKRYIGHTGKIFWVGVGKISELPKYWAVCEWGGYIPPANLGYFEETGKPISALRGKGTERWIHTGNRKDFLLKPKTPIRPLRYIFHTVQWVRRIWSGYWASYVSKIQVKGLPFLPTSAASFGFPWLEKSKR